MSRAKIANQQYKDYEPFMTVEEGEIVLTNVVDKRNDNDATDDDGVAAVVQHYIMIHYA